MSSDRVQGLFFAASVLPSLGKMVFLIQLLLSVTATAHAVELKLKYHSHPFIYFTEENIPELRKMADTTHAHIARELREMVKTVMAKTEALMPPKEYSKFGGRWNELYGNNLAPMAMYCVLYPDDIPVFEFVLEYMDVMASHPQWQVISAPKDEVPVAHSLTGFVTAYDFLYQRLDTDRRKLYMHRIFNETKEFHKFSKLRSWGKFYLQNHVATNYLALFHSCLVTFLHMPKTTVWLQDAVLALERNFKLLNHIVDGSLDEGVAYGSYTSRSFVQYVFLALRHFGIDHTSDTWLENHIWFYYNTLLPKFQRTVGIADSNHNWFYGPESQLVFLDAYVLRTGHGNWLAREIHRQRVNDQDSPLRASLSQKWCTLHTEYLWYDPLIVPVPPPGYDTKDLHTFTDWGVVTYSDRGGHPNSTFLAFKSGAMHGRAVFDVVQRDMYPWLKGWYSFNPGHEHPDQNMFVFVPNGQLFIADALYGPKLTYLNNVHSFSPSATSNCNQPWEGQLGECDKWLNWKNQNVKSSRGDVIFAEEKEGMVFVGGEAKDAYDSSMKLVSVYRSLVLLEPELLLVVDNIQTLTSSKLTHVSAFFHNLDYLFEYDRLPGGSLHGAKLAIEGKDYRIFWITSLDRSPKASLAKESHPSEYRSRQTHFVNVTLKLTPTTTRVAFVLVGPNANIQRVQFMDNHKEGCHVLVKSTKDYNVHVATRHDNIVSRHSYLGFAGFATVKSQGRDIYFGLSPSETIPTEQSPGRQECYDLVAICTLVSSALCLVTCVTLSKLRVRATARVKAILLVMLVVALVHTSIYLFQCPQDSCESCTSSSPYKSFNPVSQPMIEKSEFPSVVVTSLPGSSHELASWLFVNNPDLTVLPLPSNHIRQPNLDSIDNLLTDVCSWDDPSVGNLMALGTWMGSLPTKSKRDLFKTDEEDDRYMDIHFGDEVQPPPLNSSNPEVKSESPIYKNYTVGDLRRHVEKYPQARPVLHFTTGSWALKTTFFSLVFRSNLRQIHFVRDPRAWIANFLRNDKKLYLSLMVERVVRQFLESSGQLCAPNGKILPEFLKIRESLENFDKASPHKILALVWKAHTEAVVRLGAAFWETNVKLVKIEDLLIAADDIAREVYNFIGE